MGCGAIAVFYYFSRDLPDYHQLQNYAPPTISRIYSSDGYLISELAAEHRIFLKVGEIPPVIINAFIAAEDQNYYDHPGFDIFGIIRAALQNLLNLANDRSPVGGSTITQQVVKNFLLTNERSISRKIKEAILAYRINKIYSKDRILELYLNQIYLGNGSYGVASAALNYFDKDVKNITLDEAALLAALPKAPSILDPTKNPQKAKPRRDWVLERMLENNFITFEELNNAKAVPLSVINKFDSRVSNNSYYAESVRLELIEKYGYSHVYENGLTVYTNLNKQLQSYADAALREGLIEYDKRHGYNGPLKKVEFDEQNWQEVLRQVSPPEAIGKWQMALVLSVNASNANIGLSNGSKGMIKLETSKWARKRLARGFLGKEVTAMTEILSRGDVILVSEVSSNTPTAKPFYTLEQIPEVNGALIAIQPKTGKVVAMSGGYSFKQSKYNRATQAQRQPGSVFKPLVYLAALQKGFTPMSELKDEPIAVSQGRGMPVWTPKNYEGRSLGNITLRKSLEKSRNLATVYLITKIGTEAVSQTAMSLGIYDKAPPAYYSMALGSVETTLMKLTAAYATFAGGGNFTQPKIIDRIQDHTGEIIYRTDSNKCIDCGGMLASDDQDKAPSLQAFMTSETQQAIDPMINYQLVSMLQGVVDRGTAGRAKRLGKVVAGKTGTSNDSLDAWFIGFTPDIVVGVFVGYDNPKTLGSREQGSSVALPIFMKFMEKAVKDLPNKEFEVPQGIEFVSVDYNTGEPIGEGGYLPAVREPIKPGDIIARDDQDIFDVPNLDKEAAAVDAPTSEY